MNLLELAESIFEKMEKRGIKKGQEDALLEDMKTLKTEMQLLAQRFNQDANKEGRG